MIGLEYTDLSSFFFVLSEPENKKTVHKQFKINASKGSIIHCKLLILRIMKNI